METLAKSISVLPLTDGLGSDLGVQGTQTLLRVLSREAKLTPLGWDVGAADEGVVHRILAVKLGLDFVNYRPSSALRGSRFVLYLILFFWMLMLRLLGKYKPVPLKGRAAGHGSGVGVAFAVAAAADEVFPGRFEAVTAAAGAESCEAWPALGVSGDSAGTVRLRRQQLSGAGGPGDALGGSRRINSMDPNYVHYAATK
jgi:hypothetical protein